MHDNYDQILRNTDPLYVESMSPTGMGRSALMYNHDGGVFSSDEGRMIPDEIFKIGTVDQKPKDVIGNDENIQSWSSSFMDLYLYNSVFRPWAGLHPVKIFQDQGTVIPIIKQSFEYQIFEKQITYLFEQILNNQNTDLFKSWTEPIVKDYAFD